MQVMYRLLHSSLVPRPSIAGGRPGIHCLRMRLISPKILEDILVFFRETKTSNDVYVYIPRTTTNDE